MMKVRVEIGTDVSEKEIVLRTNDYDEEVERMLLMLQKIQKTPQLIFYKDSTEYFFSADKILFFETSERQVYAHTKNDVFVVKHGKSRQVIGYFYRHFGRSSLVKLLLCVRERSISLNPIARDGRDIGKVEQR